MTILQIAEQVIAEANKPGVMSLAGRAMEKKCAEQLKPYFKHIGAVCRTRLKTHLAQTDRPAVHLALHRIIRMANPYLQEIIARNWHEALLKADKQRHMAHHFAESFFQEYSDDEPRDDHGMWTTENTFHNKVSKVVPPDESKNPKEKKVDVKDIVPTQDKLDSNFAKFGKLDSGTPSVTEKNGKYYVNDGHHRIARDIHSGKTSIKVDVYSKESFQEADDYAVGETIDDLPSEEAAKIAKQHAAEAVVGIDAQTLKLYQDAVETAITEQLAPQGLSQLLRQVSDDMVKTRADVIARTEMADAFGEATMQKLDREQIEYKQLIPSPGACPLCLSIVAAGPIPIGEPFLDDDGEEHDRSPIHPNCRCATVGARPPEGE